MKIEVIVYLKKFIKENKSKSDKNKLSVQITATSIFAH
jgi:hypothetical protein